MKALSLAVLLAFAAAPVLAADAPAKPSTTTTASSEKPAKAEPKKEDKLICTRESDTGSFIAKRVCKTQAQIDSERRGAEQLNNDREQLSNRPDQAR